MLHEFIGCYTDITTKINHFNQTNIIKKKLQQNRKFFDFIHFSLRFIENNFFLKYFIKYVKYLRRVILMFNTVSVLNFPRSFCKNQNSNSTMTERATLKIRYT